MMTFPHAVTMALRCKAHDAAIDAGHASPFTADDMAIATAWLNRSTDADIDAALAGATAYTEHAAVPTLGDAQWVSATPPPAIGAPIIATINACGPAIVTGYFTQGGYLGVLCTLIAPPEWHVRQNNGNPRGHLFGPECEPAGTRHDITTAFGQASWARDWLDARYQSASNALAAIPGVGTGNLGLTPDDVKASEEYRRAKARYDAAFSRLRAFNAGYTKMYRAQLAADRAARRAAKAR